MAAPVPLRVCLFSGASSLPIRIADHLGLLSAAGFATELHLTKGSKQLMEGLLDGRYDVVHAAPDNFIEWRDRTGADIVAWIGGTSGPLQLIGAPELPPRTTSSSGETGPERTSWPGSEVPADRCSSSARPNC